MPNLEYNFPDNQLTLISGSSYTPSFDPNPNSDAYNGLGTGDYIRMTIFSGQSGATSPKVSVASNVIIPESNPQKYELDVYISDVVGNSGGNIYIKPNEVFDRLGFPESSYNLRFDFLRNIFDEKYGLDCELSSETGEEECEQYYYSFEKDSLSHALYQKPRFKVKEISSTRKEVRLFPWSDDELNPMTFSGNLGSVYMQAFQDLLGNLNDNSYQFQHVLTNSFGVNIPIVNYQFDEQEPGVFTLILKLQEALSGGISTYSDVNIERELMLTQTQPITYLSSIKRESLYGGLTPYLDGDIIYNGDVDNLENYEEVSSSINDNIVADLQLSSSHQNLKVNYNDFSNHTFFGSARQKLQNFYKKVSTIEDNLKSISQSLYESTSSISLEHGDSSFVISQREMYFKNIKEEINSFTPYEKFLYFDGQSVTSASAPSLGANYTQQYALRKTNTEGFVKSKRIGDYDGFSGVYKISGSSQDGDTLLFKDVYRAENSPFGHYSGSVYLSFLIKGDHAISEGSDVDPWDPTTNHNGTLVLENHNVDGYNASFGSFKVPHDSYGGSFIQSSSMTGSKWVRYVVEASQSYWRPTRGVGTPEGNIQNMPNQSDWTIGSPSYEILSGSNIESASYSGSAFEDFAYTIQTPHPYDAFATYQTASNKPFTGSIMPAGDLFDIRWKAKGDSTNITSSLLTDVKVTYNNPLEVLPFGQVYNTGSVTFENWYNGLYASASLYDEDNIHSFLNNIPQHYIDNDEGDLSTFLNMIGEHFDLIRNYIDGYVSLQSREYNKQDSSPENLLPILSNALGWELTNPFTGSLGTYFGDNATTFEGQTAKTVRDNTWKKLINNLIYIYKTKGTGNSLRALLNTYGYPIDSLNLKEYGGTTETASPKSKIMYDILEKRKGTNIGGNSTNTDLKDGLIGTDGNISYDSKQEEFYSFVFRTGNTQKTLKTDWWKNNAKANSVEFVFKVPDSNNEQELLFASGSTRSLTTANKESKLWDLSLVPSSNNVSSSLRFRLSNIKGGCNELTSSAISMSTDYVKMGIGTLWNATLQRMTGSVSGSGKQKYKMYLGYQKGSSIASYQTASMVVDGDSKHFLVQAEGKSLVTSNGKDFYTFNSSSFITNDDSDALFFETMDNQQLILSGGFRSDVSTNANQNWVSSSFGTGKNLYIGRTFSGSMGQFRTWTAPLSESIIKTRILNKLSTVGNTFTSSMSELIFNYQMNENWTSASLSSSFTASIKDSNPLGPNSYASPTEYASPTNFSIDLSDDYITSSVVYDKDIITTYRLSVIDGGLQSNENQILIREVDEPLGNLNPLKSIAKVATDPSVNKRKPVQPKIDFSRSPDDILDDFYINNLAGFRITDKFSNPQSMFEEEYELNSFRDDFNKHFGIKYKVNDYIRAQENIHNKFIEKAITNLTPARAQVDSMAVVLKPTILEKPKYRHKKIEIENNSPYDVLIDINIDEDGFYMKNYDVEISTTPSAEDSEYLKTYLKNIDVEVSLAESKYEKSYNIDFDLNDLIVQKGSLDNPKIAEYDVNKQIVSEGLPFLPYKPNISMFEDTVEEFSVYFDGDDWYFYTSDNKRFLLSTAEPFTIGRASRGTYRFKQIKPKVISIDGSKEVMLISNFDMEEKISKEASLELQKNSLYDVDSVIIKEGSYFEDKMDEIEIDIKQDGVYISPKFDNIYMFDDVTEETKPKVIDMISSLETQKSDIFDINSQINKEAEYHKIKECTYDIINMMDISQSVMEEISKNITDIVDIDSKYIESTTDEISMFSDITKETTTHIDKFTKSSDPGIFITSNNKEFLTSDGESFGTPPFDGFDKKIVETYKFKQTKPKVITLLNSIEVERESTFDVYDNMLTSGKRFTPHTGTLDATNNYGWKSFRNLMDEWGRGYDDTHFVPMYYINHYYGDTEDFIQFKTKDNVNFETSDGEILTITTIPSGPQRDKRHTDTYSNLNHYESRYVFNMIGDVEHISSSMTFTGSVNRVTDYSDIKYFKNREIRNSGEGFEYDSGFGIQDGKPVGTTAYFITESGNPGHIKYPSNHWSRLDSSLVFNRKMYEGTQNENPGFWPITEVEDLSSASFYRVKVTGGDRQIVIKNTKPTLDGGDSTIIRTSNLK